MLLTLGAFLVAIALLVAVHEWGHFAMARGCGVKVLQFSIGFGPRLVGWTSPRSGTEYRLALFPLGGFVRMLDEREAPVAAAELQWAFNRQPLRSRAAIVAAGPLANLALALVLYCCVNWVGIMEPEAIVASPPPASIAAQAGFTGGEKIQRVGFVGNAMEPVRSFEDFRWWLARAALQGQALHVEYLSAGGKGPLEATLQLDAMDVGSADATLFRSIGFVAPFAPAVLGPLTPASAAAQAGLQTGDLVLRVDGVPVYDAAQLRTVIRNSGASAKPTAQSWLVQRGGQRLDVVVTPRLEEDAGQPIGRVGAMIGGPPAMQKVRYGLVDGFSRAASRTWEVSALTLHMIGQIVVGTASVRNLSGPVTIADYAGKSAAMGWEQYLVFLALISISLGVLNLLPVPVLDGGHLLYYGWEGLTGRAVPEHWLSRLQRVGLAILLVMMSIALYNDVSRLLA